jgi:hypothetical protein
VITEGAAVILEQVGTEADPVAGDVVHRPDEPITELTGFVPYTAETACGLRGIVFRYAGVLTELETCEGCYGAS